LPNPDEIPKKRTTFLREQKTVACGQESLLSPMLNAFLDRITNQKSSAALAKATDIYQTSG